MKMMPSYCTQLTDRECREEDCCLKQSFPTENKEIDLIENIDR